MSQSSTKIAADGPNRRELYKNKKLQQSNEVFYCQCGKNYLTFSALYLHARNKHNVKLTTKRSPENCREEKEGEKSKVTYFIIPTNPQQLQQIQGHNNNHDPIQNSQNKNQDNLSPLDLVQRYLNQVKATLNSKQVEVLELFKNYFKNIKEFVNFQPHHYINDTTLYFNEFVTYYLPKQHRLELYDLESTREAENTLVALWRWMKRHQLTNYQLLHHSRRLSPSDSH